MSKTRVGGGLWEDNNGEMIMCVHCYANDWRVELGIFIDHFLLCQSVIHVQFGGDGRYLAKRKEMTKTNLLGNCGGVGKKSGCVCSTYADDDDERRSNLLT